MKFKIIIALMVMMIQLIALSTAELQAAQVLFTPELILTEQYTDNVFLSSDNEEEDFITSAGLGINTQLLGRTAGFELNYTPTYNSFADNSDLDYWRHSANLGLWNEFTRNTRIGFTDHYLETEDPLDESALVIADDPLAGPVIGVDLYRRGRTRYRTNVAEVRLDHRFGTEDRVNFGVLYGLLEDIDTFEGEPVSDYTNIQPTLGLAYWFTPAFGLELDGNYSDRDYEDENDRQEYSGFLRLLHTLNRDVSAFVEYRHTELYYDEETDSDYQVYNPSIGMRYQFQESAFVQLAAGYFIQDFERGEQNDGWVLNSEIFKRWSFRRSYVDLTGLSGYDIQDTGTEDLGFSIFYEGRLALGYNFTPHFSAEASSSYRYVDFPDIEPERSDQFMRVEAGLRYQALQWMIIGLTYNYRDFASDIDVDEYTENAVILNVTLSPTTPYRWN